MLLLERLRLPLPLAEATCEGCHRFLDSRGEHRAACPVSGRLKLRAAPVERATARVFREAGARVRWNALLKNLNIGVPADDNRCIEVVAQGLPCHGGAQLAVDCTLRCALTAAGAAQPRAAREDGAVLEKARWDKEAKYPELLRTRRCRLVVMAFETGGRWSNESADMVWQLAQARAREVPQYLRRSAALMWERRWARLLSISCATAFASSLVASKAALAAADCPDGPAPSLAVLSDQVARC